MRGSALVVTDDILSSGLDFGALEPGGPSMEAMSWMGG